MMLQNVDMLFVSGCLAIAALVFLVRGLTMDTCVECKRKVPPMCTFSISNSTQTIGPLCMQCMKKLTNTGG